MKTKRGWTPQPSTQEQVGQALQGVPFEVVVERVALALGRAIARAAAWRTATGGTALDAALAALRGEE